jgi:hypothetical protein
MPSPAEATCIKAKEGDLVQFRVTALEDISEDYTVIMKFARVRSDSKLREVVGAGAISTAFALDGDFYTRGAVPVSISNWDALPGGVKQGKPSIMPWITYAKNAQATTANRYYEFSYPTYVTYEWQQLQWNLVNKTNAFLVKKLAVDPDSNSYKTRLYIEGRVTNPEFLTRPLPEENYFVPPQFADTSVNGNLKWAGPRELIKPFLFHGVKGGIQHVDNGTSISANGVMIEVWGTKFSLR